MGRLGYFPEQREFVTIVGQMSLREKDQATYFRLSQNALMQSQDLAQIRSTVRFHGENHNRARAQTGDLADYDFQGFFGAAVHIAQ
jgi:hypothetical protein